MPGKIHSSAIVHDGAELADDVEVGPYSIIGPRVRIDAGTRIASHVVIEGNTKIGKGNRIFQFASIGSEPQDLKYKGEDSLLEIGDKNLIREYVTMNPGTEFGGGVTRIGNGNMFMGSVHIGHDCIVGNGTILANGSALSGHVILDDHAILSGFCGVHQFIRIGMHAYLGGGTMVLKDVPPYVKAALQPTKLFGVNNVGLSRHGFSDESIGHIRSAYRAIFQTKLLREEALEKAYQEFAQFPEVIIFLDFIRDSERGVCH